MSVFTPLNVTEVAQFLSQYPCGELIAYQGIKDGITNSNFYLTTTNGEYVLTIYEHLIEPKLDQILSLQQHLHLKGLPCANISKTTAGRFSTTLAGKPAALLERLPGNIHYPLTNSLCQQLGMTLAQIHLSTIDLNFSLANTRGAGWIAGMGAKLMDYLPASKREILQQELDYLGRFSQLALSAGAIHGDLFPDNVLVLDDRITGIIDFDFACHDVYLFDVCIAINAWCSRADGQLDRLRMRDMLSAYTSLRPLNQQENVAIPMMLRASALRFWLSRLQDEIFPSEGELTFTKDSDEFLSILLARRQRLSGMQR